jgi:hypothetical protein
MMPGDLCSALGFFEVALRYTVEAGLHEELARQRSAHFADFTETQLLREAAWVILCSGFREAVVRRVFDHVSLSFCDWESAEEIVEQSSLCRQAALASFRHKRKVDALSKVAELVHLNGFASFKARVLADPIETLQSLPFIGPITAVHLAKNLGLDVAKPDRHLVRLTEWLGYTCASELCAQIASETGEQVKVVDLILWRYMADMRPLAQEHGPRPRQTSPTTTPES